MTMRREGDRRPGEYKLYSCKLRMSSCRDRIISARSNAIHVRPAKMGIIGGLADSSSCLRESWRLGLSVLPVGCVLAACWFRWRCAEIGARKAPCSSAQCNARRVVITWTMERCCAAQHHTWLLRERTRCLSAISP